MTTPTNAEDRMAAEDYVKRAPIHEIKFSPVQSTIKGFLAGCAHRDKVKSDVLVQGFEEWCAQHGILSSTVAEAWFNTAHAIGEMAGSDRVYKIRDDNYNEMGDRIGTLQSENGKLRERVVELGQRSDEAIQKLAIANSCLEVAEAGRSGMMRTVIALQAAVRDLAEAVRIYDKNQSEPDRGCWAAKVLSDHKTTIEAARKAGR